MNLIAAYGGFLAVGIALACAAILSQGSRVLADRYRVALWYFRVFMGLEALAQILIFYGGITDGTVLKDLAWMLSWSGYMVFLWGLNLAIGLKTTMVAKLIMAGSLVLVLATFFLKIPEQVCIHIMDALYLGLLAGIFHSLYAEDVRTRRAARLLRFSALLLVLPVAGRSLLVIYAPEMMDLALAIWLILNATLALALSAIVLLLLNWSLMSVLRDESLTDMLTGLQNRRSLEAWYDQMQPLAARSGYQTGFLVCDLDYFKQVNDNYGHEKGDAVLKEFAEILRKSTRGSDFVARIGGEEFVVVMPVADQEAVEVLAERIRNLTAAVPFRIDDLELPVTTSIGAGLFPGETSLARAFEEADANLYMAKQAGRNRVVFQIFGHTK